MAILLHVDHAPRNVYETVLNRNFENWKFALIILKVTFATMFILLTSCDGVHIFTRRLMDTT